MFDRGMKDKIYQAGLFIALIALGCVLNVLPRALSLWSMPDYLLTNRLSLVFLILYFVINIIFLFLPIIFQNKKLIGAICLGELSSYLIALIGAFYADIAYLYMLIKGEGNFSVFYEKVTDYLVQEYWFYAVVIISIVTSVIIAKFILYKDQIKINGTSIKALSTSAILLLPFLLVWPLEIINIRLFVVTGATEFSYLPLSIIFFQNSTYAILTAIILLIVFFKRNFYQLNLAWIKKIINLAGVLSGLSIFLKSALWLLPYLFLAQRTGTSAYQLIKSNLPLVDDELIATIPIILLVLFLGIFLKILKKIMFDDTKETGKTTGNFGSASWAVYHDLKKLNAYDSQNGIPVGADKDNRVIYLPLCNKLTISPPGGGKTTASSILALLTHDGSVFAWDIKGELWAIVARYRSQVLKRKVIVIDPYGITQGRDFSKGKPKSLKKKYRINPFDWIPEDKKQRDRIINTVAASFVINEGGSATHFDENAKILIRGYIDYMMTLPPEQRGLPMLYQLMSENMEEAQLTFDQMAQMEGRAGAAANQINRVGSDERGSILSTSYRQIDWMGDSNIQETLSESNFDLRDFIKGKMDIFVVLPEDQVKEHNRLVRMIMALLMGMIVQADPSELPKKKMLFLLEELAQLGYCPDVEQCIEVLRARGVVVWTVFQTLSQIEMFEKPDLFKGAPLKQIFTNDDTKTMEWIQTLGGKKTVLTKTLSNNTGDSRQKMQVFGGSVSSGEGESIHETGVDLIQMNEIRELDKDEQFVFLHSAKPIKCKKVRYFEHTLFTGKYDINPVENASKR